MAREIKLLDCGWTVLDEVAPNGERFTLLVVIDPGSQTTYVIPWSQEKKRELIQKLSGIALPQNGAMAVPKGAG